MAAGARHGDPAAMSMSMNILRIALLASTAVGLAACSTSPPPPDWQLSARGSAERAVAAYLEGRQKVEGAEIRRLRLEIARTGDPQVLARAELLLCAAQVASLDFSGCSAFEPLRVDATAAEQAYAKYLTGEASGEQVALLPPAQQGPARLLLAPGSQAADGAPVIREIGDPLARLVAAGVWFQAGRGSPALIALAVDTASAQGWSRSLLAWLEVQARSAERAGDSETSQRARRRIDLVLSGGAPPRP